MPIERMRRAGYLLLLALFLSGCGYRVSGQSASLPAQAKTIAVPAFQNRTTHFKIEQKLSSAVIREFIARTKYQIVSDETGADLVLHGTVKNLATAPVIFDPRTGRATTVLVVVDISLELVELKTGRKLFENPNYTFREQYEISGNLEEFFEERDPALDRLARDFAATVVTAILENF